MHLGKGIFFTVDSGLKKPTGTCVHFVTSSLEHKVLKVSYCDHPVSVVHVSCIVSIYVVHPPEVMSG